jgi:hypothetical protein
VAEWGLGVPAAGSGQRRWPEACRWGRGQRWWRNGGGGDHGRQHECMTDATTEEGMVEHGLQDTDKVTMVRGRGTASCGSGRSLILHGSCSWRRSGRRSRGLEAPAAESGVEQVAGV